MTFYIEQDSKENKTLTFIILREKEKITFSWIWYGNIANLIKLLCAIDKMSHELHMHLLSKGK